MSGHADDDLSNAMIAPATPAAASALIQDGGVHQAGVRAVDIEASGRFWCGTLGLVRHPEKADWLGRPGSSHRPSISCRHATANGHMQGPRGG